MKIILLNMVVLVITTLFSGCKETAEFYLGIPLQPDIEENNYEPGLNIIGVLRPDYTDSVNRSFIYIQKVAPALNNPPGFEVDSLNIKDAEVTILNVGNGSETAFIWTKSDSIFTDTRYRPSGEFEVVPGNSYSISCYSEDLPVLTSSTIIPNEPQIVPESLFLNTNAVSFETINDTSIYLYEVFLYRDQTLIAFIRQVANSSETTRLSVNFDGNTPDRMEIFGYDYNISSYLTISNTNLNFNKYRKSFGNVENGYGVFGSLNYISVPLD